MTEKELKKYNAYKRLLERKEKELEELKHKELTVIRGKVKGSMVNFPYTEVRTSVLMDDPVEVGALNKKIKQVLSEIVDTREKIKEIEVFIGSIPEPELKLIFELRCYKELSWQEIAAELIVLDDAGDVIKEVSRQTVWRRFNNYIKVA